MIKLSRAIGAAVSAPALQAGGLRFESSIAQEAVNLQLRRARSSIWLEYRTVDPRVAGSSPVAPVFLLTLTENLKSYIFILLKSYKKFLSNMLNQVTEVKFLGSRPSSIISRFSETIKPRRSLCNS